MTRNLLAVVGCAMPLLIAAAPGQSADLGRPTVRYEPVEKVEEWQASIWNGAYVGLSAGYAWGNSEHTYNRNDNHGTAYQDLTGALASATLGYNYLVSSNFLIGVEGDIGFMDVRADDKVIFDGHVWKSQFGGLWGTVRARAGLRWDRALLYGTGGIAFMQVDEVGYGDAAGQTAFNNDFRTGWVVGGGIEYAISSRMTAKIEYLHMDFGTYNGLSENQETFSFKNDVDLVRAGVSFKF